jgi:hypothetical protein
MIEAKATKRPSGAVNARHAENCTCDPSGSAPCWSCLVHRAAPEAPKGYTAEEWARHKWRGTLPIDGYFQRGASEFGPGGQPGPSLPAGSSWPGPWWEQDDAWCIACIYGFMFVLIVVLPVWLFVTGP